MKPTIKIGTWWFFPKQVVGMTIFPFIFIDRNWANKVTIQTYKETIIHESIHIRQQLELFIIPFYFWYGIEFLIRWISGNKNAYSSLCFEQEANTNEWNSMYLKKRRFWAFIKYLKVK
jgi:hypothetical protein